MTSHNIFCLSSLGEEPLSNRSSYRNPNPSSCACWPQFINHTFFPPEMYKGIPKHVEKFLAKDDSGIWASEQALWTDSWRLFYTHPAVIDGPRLSATVHDYRIILVHIILSQISRNVMLIILRTRVSITWGERYRVQSLNNFPEANSYLPTAQIGETPPS